MDKQEGFVLVKFCKSYSKEAHICLASSGHAPEFLGIKILSDEWLMMIMKYVNGSSWDEQRTSQLQNFKLLCSRCIRLASCMVTWSPTTS